MGLLSTIGKVVSKVLPSSVSKTAKNVSKKFSGSIFSTRKSVTSKVTSSVTNKTSGSILSRIGKRVVSSLKSVGKTLKSAGKVLKKIPIIGTAITVACEIPNIYSAFKEEGFNSGMKEIGKATLRTTIALGAGLAAAAITGASFGTLGVVGAAVWAGTDFALDKWFIKSYSSMKEELAEKGITEEQIKNAQDKGIKLADLYDRVNNGSMDLAELEPQETGDSSTQEDATVDDTTKQGTSDRGTHLLSILQSKNYQFSDEELQNAIKQLSQLQNSTSAMPTYTNMGNYILTTNPFMQNPNTESSSSDSLQSNYQRKLYYVV